MTRYQADCFMSVHIAAIQGKHCYEGDCRSKEIALDYSEQEYNLPVDLSVKYVKNKFSMERDLEWGQF